MKNETIHDLFTSKKLSARSFNICEANGILDLDGMLQYYQAHGDFKHLWGIGIKSNLELIKLCENYRDNMPDEKQAELEPAMIAPVLPLPPDKLQYLNDRITEELQTFSTRTRNCLFFYFDRKINFNNIASHFPRNIIRDIPRITNAGSTTNIEIRQFVNRVYDLYDQITMTDQSDIYKQHLMTRLNQVLPKFQLDLTSFEQTYGNSQIKLFQLLDLLINRFVVFPRKALQVFRDKFGYYESVPIKSYLEIGQHLSMSRERIRQIAEKIPKQFANFLSKLESFHASFHHVYNHCLAIPDTDRYFVSAETASAINQAEKVFFTQRFYTLFLWAMAKGDYRILPVEINGETTDYLIKSDLYDAFDFLGFLTQTDVLLRRKIRKTYHVDFDQHLRSFVKNSKGKRLFPRLKAVCRYLVLTQTGGAAPFDDQGNFQFKNHVMRDNIAALALQLFEDENRPMQIKEIFERLKGYPNSPANLEQLRYVLLQDKENRFIHFGRTSTYGLRKWEAEQINFKDGTIREIVQEYLEQHDRPCHISEITAYVKQFRPATHKISIANNLNSQSDKTILNICPNFWGLAAKIDHPSYQAYKPLPAKLRAKILRYLRSKDETSFDELMSRFVEKESITEPQMDVLLEEWLAAGKIHLTDEGNLRATAIAENTQQFNGEEITMLAPRRRR